MKQAYKTQINRLKLSNKEYSLLNELCLLSKNLYNFTLYQVRQHYFQTSKYLNYESAYHLVKSNENYKLLPSQTAQQTMKFVDKDMKSFFSLLRKKQRNEYKYSINLPRYKSKNSKFLLIFTQAHFKIIDNTVRLTCNKQLLEQFNLKQLSIALSKNIKDKQIKEIRILPQLNSKWFKVAFVYYDYTEEISSNKANILSIDLGIDNLIAAYDTSNNSSFIIDGKQIKSINHFYNKQRAKYQSIAKKANNTYKTNRLYVLTERRNNIIKDSFHKISKFIIEYCKEHEIGEIIIGYNKNWKQNVNIGKHNNQNFVQIPYGKLIQYLTYKGEHYGITTTLQEESYTSKCSCLSNEKIEKKETYNGKRIHRGLYKDLTINKVINADLNGAINILRKCKSKSAKQIACNGFVNNPLKLRNKPHWSYQTFHEAMSFRS